jgi:hypothetical protein
MLSVYSKLKLKSFLRSHTRSQNFTIIYLQQLPHVLKIHTHLTLSNLVCTIFFIYIIFWRRRRVPESRTASRYVSDVDHWMTKKRNRAVFSVLRYDIVTMVTTCIWNSVLMDLEIILIHGICNYYWHSTYLKMQTCTCMYLCVEKLGKAGMLGSNECLKIRLCY